MENSFRVNYVTTLPKEGNAPRVTITGNEEHTYKVVFQNGEDIISSGECKNNQTIISNSRQWFTNWFIDVYDENNKLVFTDIFNLKNKIVFIKMDAYALGDTIAWIPYVKIFMEKHDCNIICSTFHNDLLVDSYPEILFVKPNTVIENVYCQYYIGASNDGNSHYSPIKVNEHPLQKVASSILGLNEIEIRPDLTSRYYYTSSRMNRKYITLSEYGSSDDKHWKLENGWQSIVDFLNSKGYSVLVISKEPTKLKNIIDLTGDISLNVRAIDIIHADFHIGVSSGLSWLAWSLGTHVVMISDTTPIWHEFQSNITRICANDLSKINYLIENKSTINDVITKIEYLV